MKGAEIRNSSGWIEMLPGNWIDSYPGGEQRSSPTGIATTEWILHSTTN